VLVELVGQPRRRLGTGIQLSPEAMLELLRQPALAPAVEQSMDHAPHGGSMHVRGPKI